ncbi:DUF2339 domain-containing protein [Tepidibacter hydrothermalis]|uniref:DUF2339 domain-containing protein n=1 Tax=Tepidibacter hydrothermalis TaxID=3036126 RepID=A0ABY8EKE0_9FIRM|nr:DUF2339 domain-containing protein [Tepidibacter hydrothermalis]WFD11655.1 DUF2339 domain-containing protein [Tepidibacter hydrothermalis]
MELKNKVNDLLKNQIDIISQYEELIKDLNLDNTLSENIELKKEIDNYKKNTRKLEYENRRLLDENTNLKMSLKEQIINEKISILNASKKKIDMYFNNEINKKINKLSALESSAKDRLGKIQKIAKIELSVEEENIFSDIKKLEEELNQKIKIKKEKIKKEKEDIIGEIKREYNELKSEGVSQEVIERKKKYNDIEVKIGLNWINKAGIILLLLGLASATKYTYSTWFNEYVKGISSFMLGGLLLGAGEWLNRKEKNLFALGLSGGGIGALYFSIFSSYFILNILNMPISICLSILVTMASLLLSKRYKSMTICGISLIGGYLPFFTYVFVEGIGDIQIYIAMGYLLALNLLVLKLSLERRWIYINYLSFLLNIPCFVYLAFESPSKIISIVYSILTFIMYLSITLTYPIKEKINLKKADFILLGLNTAINCLIVYELFEIGGYHSYEGMLALSYALIYFALAEFIKKSASQEKETQMMFYITAMAFSILIIPLQFGIEWATLGWLIESILIIFYSVKNNMRKMEIGGWIVLALSVGLFIIEDFFNPWIAEYFTLKYTLITLSIIYIFSLYAVKLNEEELFKYTKKGKLLTYYKYFMIISTWIYLLRIDSIVYDKYTKIYYYDSFYFLISESLITAVFAYGISKIKLIKDNIVDKISIVLYVFVDILGFGMNFFNMSSSLNGSHKVLPILILITYNIFVFFSVKDLILKLIKKKALSLEVYPMVLAIYILGSTTSFLVNQFDLNNINLIISMFFIVMSFVCISYGFKNKFAVIRRFGLGLSIFSTGKLFIFDLAFLHTGGKIIAYFCFGIVLIGISYMYQNLRRNIEVGDEDA